MSHMVIYLIQKLLVVLTPFSCCVYVKYAHLIVSEDDGIHSSTHAGESTF